MYLAGYETLSILLLPYAAMAAMFSFAYALIWKFRLGIPLLPISWRQEYTRISIAVVLLGVCATAGVRLLDVRIPFDMQNSWFYLVFATPVAEELLFRQAIYGLMEQRGLPIHTVITISSLIFGAYHLIGLLLLPQSYWFFVTLQAIFACVIGFAFGYIRHGTRSLVPTIALHSIVNGIFVIGVVVGGG
ncbi:MAG: hypothetical protein A2Z97_08720 [Bdellovibrionales bacterium GWB1_52_6]|nr:MAG: hypothetical protein A2Z97_08720 [Bdellovibrionales bacterium GWB1_52_6]OFZ05594.1 MAG: hypothetical protein A2X97_12050 [Bdellovibrionales bacterium GWA1_52_35]HCM39033.1 hypothetical protein [Bdellovibrionales bacterium]